MSRGRPDRELAAGAAKLEAILASAIDAIITIDDKGLIETANPAAEALFGYALAEFVGRNVSFLMPEPYRSEHDGYISRYLETGERRIIGFGREVDGLRRDGTTFPMHLSVSEFEVEGARYFTGIIHDLSERKTAERVLHQTQKMEAIGQLTGGVAHDFNNLLTVITGNLELLEMTLADDEQRALLGEALDAADMGARLSERLLAFARRSHLEPRVVDLNALVLGLTDMLHRTLGAQIDLSNALAPRLWPVRADPAQIESAILNLAVNARDAMDRGGKLIIEARNTVLDHRRGAEIALAPGEYVQLSVSDTGTGMPPEVQERAFEPFFTTKQAGRGTGLGLSMVYGLARQSGGIATITSKPGQGTTIDIYLPRVPDAQAESVEEAGVAGGGAGELVLMVEDDARVRRLTQARLTELGYRVIEAGNGPEALAALEQNPDVDLVFTDIAMPGGMSGYDLCDAVRATRPEMKLLLTSGYAEGVADPGRATTRDIRLLRKPYRQAELARAVREALDGG